MENDKKKFDPVISSSDAVLKQKNGFQKIAGAMIQEDAARIGEYVLDITIKSVKKTIYDIVGVILFPDGSKPGSKVNSGISKVSYRKFYDDGGGDGVPYKAGSSSIATTGKNVFFPDIEFVNMGKAQAVLNAMIEAVDEYGKVSIMDMYDMADQELEVIPATYNDYGWNSLNTARVVSTFNDTFIIKLPKVRPIK